MKISLGFVKKIIKMDKPVSERFYYKIFPLNIFMISVKNETEVP